MPARWSQKSGRSQKTSPQFCPNSRVSIEILLSLERQVSCSIKESGSDVILSEIHSEARAGLELLKGLARLATASGLLGMVGYLLWMMEGDHGLVGLQAGLPEKIAAQRGLLAMTIGACVALFAHASRGMLAPIALRTVQDATRVLRALEPMLATGSPKDGPEKAPMIKSSP